jgi:hypothetical protein
MEKRDLVTQETKDHMAVTAAENISLKRQPERKSKRSPQLEKQ